jgi:hypothetical protein
MRKQDDARASFTEVFNRRERGANSRVVADAAVGLERDVEVDAHQGALAFDKRIGEVSDGLL